jgi:hypothetical protein
LILQPFHLVSCHYIHQVWIVTISWYCWKGLIGNGEFRNKECPLRESRIVTYKSNIRMYSCLYKFESTKFSSCRVNKRATIILLLLAPFLTCMPCLFSLFSSVAGYNICILFF